MNDLPWNNNSWEVAAQIAARWSRNVAGWNAAAASMASMNTAEPPLPLRTTGPPQVLMQAVIVPGARTNEGKLIEAVALPWFDIIALLKDDPNLAFQISPEKWEEIVAGAYHRAGFDEVTLT